jgi:CobQ-like glutamine amidotransferase family enzyme
VKSSEATNQNYLRRGQYFITAVDELEALITYTNNELAKYSSTYGASVKLITFESHNGHERAEKFSKIGTDHYVKGNNMNAEDDRAYYKRQYDKFMENPLNFVREQREE